MGVATKAGGIAEAPWSIERIPNSNGYFKKAGAKLTLYPTE